MRGRLEAVSKNMSAPPSRWSKLTRIGFYSFQHSPGEGMESIIAALISAVASVIVAVISRNSPTSEKNTTPEGSGVRTKAAVTSTGKKQWVIALSILVPWLLVSPPLIHWDLAGLNVFVILAVTLVIAFAWPIKPLAAAAIVLILHPISF